MLKNTYYTIPPLPDPITYIYIILYIVTSGLFSQLRGARAAIWDIVGHCVLTSELRDLK